MNYRKLHFINNALVVSVALSLVFGFVFCKDVMAKGDVPESFAELADKVGHVAVNISSTKVVKTMRRFFQFPERGFKDFFGDEFFRHFFGEMPEEQMKQRSLGSGLVVSDDGYILTNNHVVADAEEIMVTFSEQERYEATISGLVRPMRPIAHMAISRTRVLGC